MKEIKLTTESEQVIKSMASILNTNGKEYYFMPYWFEKTDKPNVFKVHSLGNPLPADLQQYLNSARDIAVVYNLANPLTPDECYSEPTDKEVIRQFQDINPETRKNIGGSF